MHDFFWMVLNSFLFCNCGMSSSSDDAGSMCTHLGNSSRYLSRLVCYLSGVVGSNAFPWNGITFLVLVQCFLNILQL